MKWITFGLLPLTFYMGAPHAQSISQQWILAMAVKAESKSDTAISDAESGYARQLKLQGALQYGDWEGQLSFLYEAESGQGESSELVVEELFWQGDWSGWDLMAGKRRLGFGVSYAHRPVDVFLPVERNPVYLHTNEGVAVVSASRFTESGELSLMLVDANASRFHDTGLPRGLAVRWYQLGGVNEWQLLGYLDDQRGLSIGGSLVTTYGESWELHTEGRYQQRYKQWKEPSFPEAAAPSIEEERRDGWQALLGMTWTHSEGHSLIAEYWYDSRAWRAQDWQELANNAHWYRDQGSQWDSTRYTWAAAFLGEGRNRHNLMLHWSASNHRYNPKLDLLYSPEDRGVVVTVGCSRELRGYWTLDGSVRYFGGAKNSYLAQLPIKTLVTLTTNRTF
ncbi:hypothetical protein [uncultured Microbulbifer sp.]|uniref:hypothetical protein n=1 Tax=uncultured Microbulbifer sp. TaxID=348147 RepID=UPI002612EBE9|nr:hypothetical protein [uncultured Microbulbifer sp.]